MPTRAVECGGRSEMVGVFGSSIEQPTGDVAGKFKAMFKQKMVAELLANRKQCGRDVVQLRSHICSRLIANVWKRFFVFVLYTSTSTRMYSWKIWSHMLTVTLTSTSRSYSYNKAVVGRMLGSKSSINLHSI